MNDFVVKRDYEDIRRGTHMPSWEDLSEDRREWLRNEYRRYSAAIAAIDFPAKGTA